MISARYVQCFEARHALPAYQGVLDSGGQGVSDVQVPCYVRGRQADRELLGIAGCVVRVIEFAALDDTVLFLPELAPVFLYLARVVAVVHLAGVPLQGDGFCKREQLLLLLLLNHVGCHFLGLSEVGEVLQPCESEHFVLGLHILYNYLVVKEYQQHK